MDKVLYGVGAGRIVVGGRITPGFLLDLGPAVAPQRGVFEDCEFPLNSMNGHMKPSQVDIAGGYIQCHHKSGQCHWVNRS